MTGLFLALLPTPGGDKYHLFEIKENGVIVTNDMGPKETANFHLISGGIGFTLDTGPVDHIFELDFSSLILDTKVAKVDSGEVMVTFQVPLVPTDTTVLPENPPAPDHPQPPAP